MMVATRPLRSLAVPATLVLLAVGAGAVISHSLPAAVALGGALSLATLGLILGGSSGLLIVSAFVGLSAGLVDAPGHFAVGSLKLSALLSITYLGLGLLLWLSRPMAVPKSAGLRCWVILLAWAVFVSVPQGIGIQGAQNLVILALFLVLVSGTAPRVGRSTALADRVWALLKISAVFPVALYWIELIQGGLGAGGLVSARAFALFALVPLSLALAEWRRGSRLAMIACLVLVLTIAASLSRTALLSAVIITLLAWVRPTGMHGALRAVSVVVVASAFFWFAVRLLPQLDQRFTIGDSGVVAGISINTSGRLEIWRIVWDSYLTAPIVGQGAGSSETLLTMQVTGGDHPHDDYLRVLHDYGLIGLVMMLGGLGAFLVGCWRAWKRALIHDQAKARFHLGALLLLVAFAITMLTDNTFVYADILAPLALVLGVSLGLRTRGTSAPGTWSRRTALESSKNPTLLTSTK